MLSMATLFLSVAGIVTIHVLWTFLMLLLRQSLSPLRHLPGPRSPSFFMGNLREMHDQENNDLVARWEALYGSTFVYRGFIGGCRLMTTDPTAVGYIMSRAYDYPKPDFVRDSLASMAAGKEGLLTVEGEDHRRQRRVLTPAFSSLQVKLLSPIFWEKAVQLRDIWFDIAVNSGGASSPPDPLSSSDKILSRTTCQQLPLSHSTTAITTSFLPNPFSTFIPSKSPPTSPSANIASHNAPVQPPKLRSRYDLLQPAIPPSTKIDVLAWLARATLDVIGQAGFGYTFDSLADAACSDGKSENELARAFGIIFSAARKFRVITILQVWFPILRKFNGNNAAMKEARATMRRIGLELIEQRSAVLTNEQAVPSDSQMMSPINSLSDIIEGDKTVVGRDLLGILIRSNSASVPSQRLSREEILCQISTFLAAGHETTASALTWILYSLACAPDVQITLRTHLRNIPIPSSSACMPSPALLDAIERLPYLSYVVREGLRLHAPVTSTMRVATADDVIPVSSPFRDRRGRLCSAIHVRRGDIISVPIQAMNRSKAIWGEDAGVFRPERWAETRDEKTRMMAGSVDKSKEGRQHTGVQGLWGNILTFGNGNPVNGNRACIGYRFALSEIKIFLFVLVRDIEFSIDPSIEIEKKVNVVTRPCVKSEPHRGNQMPLYVRRVPPDDASPHSSSTINL